MCHHHVQAVVRAISTSVNEVFQRLQAQQEAKAREQEEEPGVRPHMLRRLSTPKKPDDPELRRGNERVTAVAASHPLNSSHPSNSHSLDISNSSHPTSFSSPVHSPVVDEIDRQFSSVFTPPTSPTTTTTSLQQPKVRRVSREERPVENTMQQQRFQLPQQLTEEDEEEESDESMVELQAPLKVSHGHHHDGNVHQQMLEDTKGVKISDRRDILVPKRDTRPSLLMQNVFSPPPPVVQPSTAAPPPVTSSISALFS